MDVLEAAVRGVSVEGDLAKLAAVLRDTERTRGYSRALQLLDWDWKRMEANNDVVVDGDRQQEQEEQEKRQQQTPQQTPTVHGGRRLRPGAEPGAEAS